MKRLFLSALVLLSASPLFAQTVPPALMVKVKDQSEPLRMSKIQTEVRIVGYVAETITTMTFANPYDRVLQGDLYFPLPSGSTISGYALDINGEMIDGVAVEKHKGREVFEKIVRQNVDPGLIEWTQGNSFQTRVFPIPAKGSRTIRVEYVTELAGETDDPAYHLPLNFSRPVDDFSLRIEVVKQAVAPRVAQGGLPNFDFKKWRESYLAETRLTNVTLTEDLLVAVPNVEKQRVVVERTPAGDCYFAIHDLPAVPASPELAPRPQHIVLFWDASGSRAGKHERELAVVEQYLKTHGPAPAGQPLLVDLVVLRNDLGSPLRFEFAGSDFSPLLDRLETIDYDGGTQLGTLASPAELPAPDFYLLVSDGLSNFGRHQPADLDALLYVLSADVAADHAYLKNLAAGTGGRFFDLSRLTDQQVVDGIGQTAYSFLSTAGTDSGEVNLYPQMPEPLAGRFTLVGRLTGDEATVNLNYGYPGRPEASRSFRISRSGAAEGSLLERLWAQKKLAELILLPDQNRDEILQLGKRFGMVTPHTSLIVLDSLEQYVEHDIAPPESLPEMREEYNRRIDTIEHQRRKQQADKLATLLAMWEARVEWYNQEFKYPENFRYKEEEQKEDAAAEDGARPGLLPRLMQRFGGNAAPGARDEAGEADADMPAPTTEAPEDAPAEEPVPADPQGAPAHPFPSGADGGGAPAAGGEGLSRNNATLESGTVTAAKQAGEDTGRQPGIAVKQWDPKTPYLKDLRAADPADALAVYMRDRAEYGQSPAFYLDCADFFRQQGDDQLALQVLSNVAELELENAQLLRVLAHRLTQLGYLDLAILTFEQVLDLRPEEPQSYRDLALVLAARADLNRRSLVSARVKKDARREAERQLKEDYGRALELLHETVIGHWDGRFEEIELIALTELNRILPLARAAGVTEFQLDKRLEKLLQFDVRIVMTWHADNTDIDLWVIEPSGEKAFYSHNRTTIGGAVSRDFTGGYGPEEYLLRRAMKGMYQIKANYYGSSETRLLGEVTVQVDIFTNFGRDNEQHQALTVRLKNAEDTVDIGEVEF